MNELMSSEFKKRQREHIRSKNFWKKTAMNISLRIVSFAENEEATVRVGTRRRRRGIANWQEPYRKFIAQKQNDKKKIYERRKQNWNVLFRAKPKQSTKPQETIQFCEEKPSEERVVATIAILEQ